MGYIGVIIHLLTIDPNFLGHPSGVLSCQPSSSMRAGPPKISSPRHREGRAGLRAGGRKAGRLWGGLRGGRVAHLRFSIRQTNTSGAKLGKNIWGFPKIVGFPSKSSILIGFSIINHPFWGTPIWKHPYGNIWLVQILDWSNIDWLNIWLVKYRLVTYMIG